MDDVTGWIFVSHSTKDLEAVRRVRDYLEAKSHHPLLFFLKCIRETDELDSLITREITARNIFLLCDSPQARSARWVQREVECIRALPDRHCEVLDLESPWPQQQTILDRISQRGTLFLSYAHSDVSEVATLSDALRGFDYSIFFDHRLSPGDDWRDRSERAIDESLSKGWFIYFVSRATNEQQQSVQLAERAHALQGQSHFPRGTRNVIVALVGNLSAHVDVQGPLSAFPRIDLRGLEPPEQARRLHHVLCTT